MSVSRLTSRPGVATGGVLGAAVLHVPPGLPAGPVPLVVMLHGATSDPAQTLPYLRDRADRGGFLVLVPKSAGRTWDAIGGAFGPDVAALDRALGAVFASYEVDGVTIAGFSDGASYAFGLGLANGDLFRRVVAFSPGFVPPAPRVGTPAVFVSHGVDDRILPIDRCSRRIVPVLRAAGYEVDYREFDGGHLVPPSTVVHAFPLEQPESAIGI